MEEVPNIKSVRWNLTVLLWFCYLCDNYFSIYLYVFNNVANVYYIWFVHRAHNVTRVSYPNMCYIKKVSSGYTSKSHVSHVCIMILPEFINAIGIFLRPAVDYRVRPVSTVCFRSAAFINLLTFNFVDKWLKRAAFDAALLQPAGRQEGQEQNSVVGRLMSVDLHNLFTLFLYV